MQFLLDAYELYGQSIQDLSFDWIDLGSFGSPDAYHLPLICLPGNVMCIEGRSDGDDAYSVYSSITQKRSQVHQLQAYVGASDGPRFFYETPEGGGSSFFQDRISWVY